VKYGYDYADNRTWREDAVAKSQTTPQYHDEFYSYEGLHRLKDTQRGQLTGSPSSGVTNKNFAQDWTLDQLGNWPAFKQDNDGNGTWDINQTRGHNDVNEITQINSSSTNVAHDAAGNMTKIATSSGTFDAKYDAWNRLVKLTDGPSYIYRYDGLNRRIQKVLPFGAPTLDYYYNEEWQLLEERQSGSSHPLAQYVWHPYYVDALAVRYYDSDVDGVLNENNDGRHYYLQDANYNVTAVVSDSSAVLERYRYSPYGEVTFLNTDFTLKFLQTSALGNTHLYTGRERDPETGLQLNRNRFYVPPLGRWANRDPIGYAGGTLNLYQYVESKPLIRLDSYGLFSLAECAERGRICREAGSDAYRKCMEDANGNLSREIDCGDQYASRLDACANALADCRRNAEDAQDFLFCTPPQPITGPCYACHPWNPPKPPPFQPLPCPNPRTVCKIVTVVVGGVVVVRTVCRIYCPVTNLVILPIPGG
jgi:RHS repeat-associated protein